MKDKNTKTMVKAVFADNLSTVKRFLEEEARNGWILKDVYGSKFTFTRCDPMDVVFAVEIFDKASEFDTFVNDQNLEYIDYCEAAGWTYVCSMGYVQYFYSKNKDITPIETNPKMRFKAICKATASNNICSNILIPLVAILSIFVSLGFNRFSAEISFTSFSTNIVWIYLFVRGVVSLIRRCMWKARCKKSINSGGDVIELNHLSLVGNCIVLGSIFTLWSISGVIVAFVFGDMFSLIIPVICLIAISIVYAISGVVTLGKKAKVNKTVNIVLQIVIPIVLINIVTVALIVVMVLTSDNAGDDNVDVTLADLGIAYDSDNYENSHNNYGSFIMKLDNYYSGVETHWIEEGEIADIGEDEELKPYVDYNVYYSGIDFVIDDLVNDSLKGNIRTYSIDSFLIEGIKSETSYGDMYSIEENGYYKYALVSDNTVVTINTNVSLDDTQLNLFYNAYIEK